MRFKILVTVLRDSCFRFSVRCHDVQLIGAGAIAYKKDVTSIGGVAGVFVVRELTTWFFCRRQTNHIRTVRIDREDIKMSFVRTRKYDALSIWRPPRRRIVFAGDGDLFHV